ncbi:phosphate/phosphite/phosphonate ABC transporter substrate-binding protein [Rhodococcus sp. HNM0569]|uniref:phosphate/phosphite/phosphonate ABC transporter substrate-binding protein n=1 Tax=Rhodococcus sp. HNM0569 TaxID=2716340 RepID=UPI00146C7FE0|nr:phosphate/phosphite/phosphonate ABC transporter substrate-binding protein [Rhodococcus sp. HNM0569]NLU83610.1 phosphate/phosphite/phosphonate ABC transporter substrate-binding protein [Rhodococcus sp. HNM0569]
MRTRVPAVAGALAAASAVLLSGCAGSGSASSDDVIRFATLPLTDDPNAATPVDTIADLLEAETGYRVEVTDVPNYSAVIEAIRAGHEDIGIMSGFPSALAVNTGEVDSLVAWPGNDDPVSTCLVLNSSPLHSLADITADTTVAFADPASSSGYFMPVHMLHEAGLEKDTDYTVLVSGGHDRSLLALKNGQADVACTSTIFPAMAGQGNPMFPFEEGETRSLGDSISMPVSSSILGNPRMSDDKRRALIDALPKVFSAENKDELGLYGEAIGDGIEPVVEPDPSLFQPFVDVAAVADVDISDLE